jgi:vacuolar-type H+-ATPase subunit I/STV1
MASSNKKKRASSLRNAAAAAGARRTGRFPKSEVVAHVQRFREMHARDPEFTQEQYAKTHHIAAGTFSRWMSEAKAAVPAEERPVKGLLPAAVEESANKLAVHTDSQVAKKAVALNEKAEKRISELETRLSALQREKEGMIDELARLTDRNTQLTIAAKALAGQL